MIDVTSKLGLTHFLSLVVVGVKVGHTPENLQRQEVMMHLKIIVTAVMRMTVEAEA